MTHNHVLMTGARASSVVIWSNYWYGRAIVFAPLYASIWATCASYPRTLPAKPSCSPLIYRMRKQSAGRWRAWTVSFIWGNYLESLHLIVGRIDVNIRERWFNLHGIIQRSFPINPPSLPLAARPATNSARG